MDVPILTHEEADAPRIPEVLQRVPGGGGALPGAGSNPGHAPTGNGGYLRYAGSLSARWQRQNVLPRALSCVRP